MKSHLSRCLLLVLALGCFLPAASSQPAEKIAADLGNVLRGWEAIAARATGSPLPAEAVALSEAITVDTSVLNPDHLGRIQVYFDVSRTDYELLLQLEQAGVAVEAVSEELNVVQARLQASDLEQVSRLPEILRIRLAERGYVNAGSVITEGDAVIRANKVREELKVQGTGIRVGVIADGVDGLAQSIFKRDLPSTGVTSLSFRADGNLYSGSEGTAILEIIHDVAPEARLFFANFQTSIEFMAAQNWLADRCDVVIDAVSFFNNGSYDGTSPVSSHTSSIVGRGLPYVTSVGNYAERHAQGLYRDANGNSYHEFGQPNAAGETLNITLFPNSSVGIYLQWDDQFGASGNNYDLYLTDPNNPETVVNNLSSKNVQDGKGDPTEFIPITYTGTTPVTYGIAIKKVGNAAARTLELFLTGNRFQLDEFIVRENSVPNNSDASNGVLSIGAMSYRSTGDLEAFSSRGPTNDGRMKPDFVAPDGVTTGAPNYSSFFGTSSSAAHAAGVVALILSASPNLAPAQVASFLRAGAVDIGNLGADNMFGFGRIDAFQPVNMLANLPPPKFFSNIEAPAASPPAQAQEDLAEEGSLRVVALNNYFEVAGWAIASRGIQKVEILLDGVVVARATYGLPRPDVCTVYQNYPGCPNVGFVAQLNSVPPGNHSLAIRMTDNTGNVASQPEPPIRISVDPSSITAFVDSPVPGASVGPNFTARGWAVSNLGVRTVDIFLDGLMLQQANYGTSRPDVCAAFPNSLGCPNVGFTSDLSNIPPGPHQLIFRFTDNGGGSTQIIRSITVTPSQVLVNIDVPTTGSSVVNGFAVSGWAIATQSVDRVELLIDNQMVTLATLGGARGDVCVVFPGYPQCPNVGFNATLSGIATGTHSLTARAVDKQGNTATATVSITVTGGDGGGNIIAGSLDSPTGGILASPFQISGWAVAQLGILRIEVLLDNVVVSNATYGAFSRPDVCAVYVNYPGCPNVGYVGSVTASPGAHTLQIRIVANGNATQLVPEAPVGISIQGDIPPPSVEVPPGTYLGSTGQLRDVYLRLLQTNVITARELNVGLVCEDEAGILNFTPINFVGGSFTHSSTVVSGNPDATQGTYTIQGTYNAATKSVSGTFSVEMTSTTAGRSCRLTGITWSASLKP